MPKPENPINQKTELMLIKHREIDRTQGNITQKIEQYSHIHSF
jgi:hypothetical protein